MASVDFSIFTYRGSLAPSQEHYWEMTRSDWTSDTFAGRQFQINVSAAPLVYIPYTGPQQLMVKDVRTTDNGANYILSFTVRNTGPNTVTVYFVTFSFVKG